MVGPSRGLDGKTSVHVSVPGPSGQSVDQEQAMFVLGDSDDEDSGPTAATDFQDVPPPYTGVSASTVTVDETVVGDTIEEETVNVKESTPSKYYIQPGDTLRGIALKHDVDVSVTKVILWLMLMRRWQGRKVCQLNSLPFSTLSTTPHLLHTRRWITLPSTGRPLVPPDPKVLEAHDRERAEKRFQFVTKEIDWRVAKAYVALAEDEDGSTVGETKGSLSATTRKHSSEQHVLEARAVDQYLDDGEWESEQSGGPRLQGFPLFAVHKENGKAGTRSRLSTLIWH